MARRWLLLGVAGAAVLGALVFWARLEESPAPAEKVPPISIAAERWERWERFKAMSASEVLERLDPNAPDLIVVNRLADLGDPVAIPALEQAFERSDDSSTRGVVAAALVGLGAQDERYFTYLENRAKAALSGGIPFPHHYDEQGRLVTDSLNPDFVAWAEQNGMSVGEAYQKATQEDVGAVMMLAWGADRRAAPVLLQALASPNYFVATVAAQGLARLELRSAVPMIIEAAEAAPLEPRQAIASWLLYFPEERAQSAAARLIDDADRLALEQRAAEKRGSKGVFQ